MIMYFIAGPFPPAPGAGARPLVGAVTRFWTSRRIFPDPVPAASPARLLPVQL